ncbi:hypothetical protein BOSE62_71256 [Bosea sp. 62]|nr:hypothetical protein BOSE21B_90379 [Bosea sp. 21B]CAD5295972.1 hypothetical protein BOSE46_80468 [Bosea sp. 46]CAD5298003.1 hypothetical protein BOSE7B_60289 [Bosea sp. 7B]VVT61025.1 hypothetical protein BOS5A_230302 [Bosea sp. EC-HK365B]VXB31959.1 hypothetical protein BOSE127_110286 [Bosea sp. 127]VXB60977.1 hypothetical protein BOSE125_131215 [Bosea sp. 125]VXC77878.1 hypothetical protein BOSE29B_80357 [Bosea sp. 29B]VXC88924.1 hypothetical protein BOSE62_71256 [Bosea sp. 62]
MRCNNFGLIVAERIYAALDNTKSFCLEGLVRDYPQSSSMI